MIRFWKIAYSVLSIIIAIIVMLWGPIWETFDVNEKNAVAFTVINFLEKNLFLDDLTNRSSEDCKIEENDNLKLRCLMIEIFFIFVSILVGILFILFFVGAYTLKIKPTKS